MSNNLRDIYLDEAEDLFKKMEESLLLLDKSPDESDILVADIFRSMHTLKGSSGMFGSVKVADFVHNLETVYDLIRTGAAKLSKELIDVTFESLDHLKKIVIDFELEDEENRKNHKSLEKSVHSLLLNLQNDTFSQESKTSTNKVTYHIHFKPNRNIFQNGTNPLLLIDELSELGKTKVYTYFDNSLTDDSFDPINCYTGWNILLVKERNIDSINDVFIFVHDDAEIKIQEIYDGNLFRNRFFWKSLPENNYKKDTLDQPSIKSLVKNVELNSVPEEQETQKTEPDSTLEKTTMEVVKTDEEISEDQSDSKKVKRVFDKVKATQTVRVPAKKLDELMNLVSELVTTQASLSLFSENQENSRLEGIAEDIEKLTRQLRDTAFGMTLVQISNLFNRFERVTRDISSQLGKDIDFVTEGGETELDKRIIENISDPLLHLIRNSLDHGIESKEERLLSGKPESGTITLRSFYSGAKVMIQIEDDGGGIDPEKIFLKAVNKGLVSKDEILSKKEIFNLIFTAGFSMAKNVTDISGRGVGMDVVKRNIHDLRGDIEVDSKVGVGTIITLGLPLTLSVIDGLLVKVSGTFFVIPLMEVERCYGVKKSEIVNEFNQLASIEGDQLPFLDLRQEFNLTENLRNEFVNLVIVKNRGTKIAIAVDSIEGEYQAVLKPVGKFYGKQEFISGATILGDGTMALVLDAYKIVEKKDLKSKSVAS